MLTGPPPPTPVVLVSSVGGGLGGNRVSTRGSRTGLIGFGGKSGSGPLPGPECTCLNEVMQTSGLSTLISPISVPGAAPVVVSAVHFAVAPAPKILTASACMATQCSAAPKIRAPVFAEMYAALSA